MFHHCLLHSVTSGGAGILCVPSGIWGTLFPTTVSCTPSPRVRLALFPVGIWGHCAPARCHLCCVICARMGPGCSVFPTGTGGHSTVPPVLCHLIPRGKRGTPLPGPCHLHSITAGPGRAGPHSAGAVCPGCVRGLFAISPGAACGRARCQPQAGEGGAGAAGARAGSAAGRAAAAAGPGRWHLPWGGTAAPGDTGTRGHGPAAAPAAARRSGLRGQAGPAAGAVGRWSTR